MADAVGITLIKQHAYRGDASEEYSNQYWLSGAIPADSAAWKALADALAAQEKTVYPAATKIVRAYGYDSDVPGDPAVWSWDYLALSTAITGTLNVAGGTQTPGDCAVWVRWKTSKLNTKGKSIYLRKYFHPAFSVGTAGAGADQIWPAQLTALNALGLKLYDGTFLGARHLRAQAWDEPIVAHVGSAYITTRTLKRRGKRPGS